MFNNIDDVSYTVVSKESKNVDKCGNFEGEIMIYKKKQTCSYNETNTTVDNLKWLCIMSEIMSDEISLDQLEIESITGNCNDNFSVFILLCI